MKKLSFAAAALAALIVPAAAQAQAEGQINASATIAQVLAFDNTSAQAISFGTLSPDQTVDVSAEGYIPLKHNVDVQIWFASLPDLQVGTTGPSLTTGYECSVSGSTTAGAYEACPGAQDDVASGSVFHQTATGGVQTNYVHVKATLGFTDVNAAAPGLYEGTIEVRAAKSTI